MKDLGTRILERCERLAQFTEQSPGLTRTFGTDMHRGALDCIAEWMRQAGLTTRMDAAGNLIGHCPGTSADGSVVMMGSHQDTVRNAGRYDGMLGILAPLAALERLRDDGARLPFPVELIVFTDEEGVRFQTTLLGSRAVSGTFDPAVLDVRDGAGITLREAMRGFGLDPERVAEAAYAPGRVQAFVETHIEQGPQLERAGCPLGVVTAIAGGTRLRVELEGDSGHAGTVPMSERRDALCAAAEAVLVVERFCRESSALVGTVGSLEVDPGAVNVIPGAVTFTVDLRAPDDRERRAAADELCARLRECAVARGIECRTELVYETGGCTCSPDLVDALARAAEAVAPSPPRLFSGAGHDTLAMSAIAPVAMLFVRCRGGVSHHPDEAITAADARVAAEALQRFLLDYAGREASPPASSPAESRVSGSPAAADGSPSSS